MDLFNFDNKVAIVTGGSKGLGKAVSIGLAELGAKVVVVSRNTNLIEETAESICQNGGEAIALSADVKNGQDIERVVKETTSKYGKIDILVNNAGIAPMKRIISISDTEWNDVFDTNLRSIFLMAKAVAPIMMEQKYGKVINIGSVLGLMASNTAAHYCASKAGVVQLTRAIALEWAPFNINVNCIAPGFFATEMTKEQQENEKHQKFLNGKIPFKRLGQPEEIVGATVFLASDAASYVTGSTIYVDGGYTIW